MLFEKLCSLGLMGKFLMVGDGTCKNVMRYTRLLWSLGQVTVLFCPGLGLPLPAAGTLPLSHGAHCLLLSVLRRLLSQTPQKAETIGVSEGPDINIPHATGPGIGNTSYRHPPPFQESCVLLLVPFPNLCICSFLILPGIRHLGWGVGGRGISVVLVFQ